MTQMNFAHAILFCSLFCLSCGTSQKARSGAAPDTGSFPVIKQDGKTAIVAHRGFWNCEAAHFSENSIASLKAAQDAGLWGSECDVHLTADGIVIVNHNNDIAGKLIREHNFADFAGDLLPNGERRPSFDEYLQQAKKSSKTMLIVEFKSQKSPEQEEKLVDESIRLLKSNGMFSPDRVGFISFSVHACEYVARTCPGFINQFLTSNIVADENPAKYAEKKINGVDYKFTLFHSHPEWAAAAKSLGMSVNVWTVNDEAMMREMFSLGVHAITTNEPLKLREILGDKEFKK